MLGILLGLLVLVMVLLVVFWLTGIALSALNAPPIIRSVVLALIAIVGLIWLFAGQSPFYGPHVTLFR